MWSLCICLFRGPDRKWPLILPTSRHERHRVTRLKMIPQITAREKKDKGKKAFGVGQKSMSQWIGKISLVLSPCSREQIVTQKIIKWYKVCVSLREKRWLVNVCQVPSLLAFDLINCALFWKACLLFNLGEPYFPNTLARVFT